jgi:peptidoglycan/LPS O-acetylase OafA/YrhL
LLLEKQETGSISLRHFFMRRILRIWPGYYLLIVIALVFLLKLSFFRIPGTTDNYLHADYNKSNLFYYFFLPHLQPFFYTTGPYVHQTYTIGIEEQFYFIWGLLFFLFSKRMYPILILLLIAAPLLNFLHDHIGAGNAVPKASIGGYVKSAITYFQYSRFSTFAIGSLFGYAYFRQQSWIFIFRKWWVQLCLYSVLIASIASQVVVPYFYHEYISIIMGCVMLIATFKNESLINFSAGWISYLGKISYGIYLFHIIAIVLACKLVQTFNPVETNLFITLLLCLLTMCFSILFGYLSYYYFERYFLMLKKKFRRSKDVPAIKPEIKPL